MGHIEIFMVLLLTVQEMPELGWFPNDMAYFHNVQYLTTCLDIYQKGKMNQGAVHMSLISVTHCLLEERAGCCSESDTRTQPSGLNYQLPV